MLVETSLHAPSGERHAERLLELSLQHDRISAQLEVAALTEKQLATTGRGLLLSGANLAGRDLSGFDLRHAILNRAQLHGTNLDHADLSGASLVCCGMERTRLTGAKLRGSYLHALAAQACDFRNANLSGVVDATGALFHGCNLAGVDANQAVLSGTTFYQCNLEGAGFREASLQGCSFNESLLSRASFRRASLSEATFTKCIVSELDLGECKAEGLTIQRITGADRMCLSGACLPRLRLHRISAGNLDAQGLSAIGLDVHLSVLPMAQFSGAQLSHSRWDHCALDGIDFSGADFSDSSFVSCSADKADFDAVRSENLRILECRFPDTTFRQFAARCLVVRDSDLSNADFSGAYLYRAMITGDPPGSMRLRNAVLTGANLTQAYIAADLTTANLQGATAVYCRFNQAILRQANLAGMNLFQGSLIKTDLTDSRMDGVRAPVFADRCPGLTDALEKTHDDGLLQFVARLRELLAETGESSS
jgi:uncharacterized protein YjbI with pentapeptide repeats